MLRILVVEDDLQLATTLKYLVEDNPRYRVVATADDADSAIAAAEEHDPDLALLDLHLAHGQTGFPVAVRLNDLGVAYFNRNRNGDLKLARENLEAAIELDKTFKPAVFNLVLLNEVEGLTADANQKIIRYLELDPDSDWAQELRNRISPKDR